LTDSQWWDEAAEECEGILHIAFPAPVEPPKNVDEIVRIARDGTHVLKLVPGEWHIFTVADSS
jgi:hypothetical protein